MAERARVFRCPNCKETINTTAENCPYCSISIDHRAAEAAADLMDRVNQACSEATDLKAEVAATGGEVFLFGLLGSLLMRLWAFAITRPVMAIRWWIRFGAIRTDDPNFIRAKRDVMRTSGFAAITLLVLLIITLVSFYLTQNSE